MRQAQPQTYIKLCWKERWLQAALCGYRCGRKIDTNGGRTTLLQDLRAHVIKACNGDATVVDGATEEAAEYDPMADVDDFLTPKKTGTRGDGAKRARYYKNHAKGKITEAIVLANPPEEGASDETRKVKLYVVDRLQIWMHMSDVEWAVMYLYKQLELKGVPQVAGNSAGPRDVD